MPTTLAIINNGDALDPAGANKFIAPINNLEGGLPFWGGDTGGISTAYTATVAPAPAGNAGGLFVSVVLHVASGVAPTFSLNGQSALPILSQGIAPPAGSLLVGSLLLLVCDGAHWHVVGSPDSNTPYGVATTADDLTYSVTTAPAQLVFSVGDRIIVKMPSANAGGMSLVVNGLASVVCAKDTRAGGLASMGADDTYASVCYEFTYADSAGTKYWKIGTHPIAAVDLPGGIYAGKISSGSVLNTHFDFLATARSPLQVHTILTKTADYNVAAADTYVEAGHATVPITLTLLAIGASDLSGRTVVLANTGAVNVTVAVAGGGTVIVLTAGQTVTLIAGSAWRIVALY